MTSEQVLKKAVTYLGEGRVKVPASPGTVASVQSPSGEVYSVKLVGGEWTCDCPSRSPHCAHVEALHLITTPSGGLLRSSDRRTDIDDFLNS